MLRFRTNVDDWVACDAAHRLRFEAAADGGLTPYLHVRADLWAKVTRALYYDLVDMGEERVVDGRADVRGRFVGRVLRDGGCRAGEGRALNEPMLKTEPTRSARRSSSIGPARGSASTFRPAWSTPTSFRRAAIRGTDRMLEIIARERPIRPAAVLIPVVDHPQPTVLLTQRSAHLNDHAGQISFPGGKIDATDASPLDAALREAWEEVGLEREFIDPIGYLDLYATSFGFRILPTVARIKPGFRLRINEAEVDDAFEVPLAFLMDPANHQLHSKEFRGMERSYYAMPFAERYIWGATAGILRVLYERIYLP